MPGSADKRGKLLSHKSEGKHASNRDGNAFGFLIGQDKPRIPGLKSTAYESVEALVARGDCLRAQVPPNSYCDSVIISI